MNPVSITGFREHVFTTLAPVPGHYSLSKTNIRGSKILREVQLVWRGGTDSCLWWWWNESHFIPGTTLQMFSPCPAVTQWWLGSKLCTIQLPGITALPGQTRGSVLGELSSSLSQVHTNHLECKSYKGFMDTYWCFNSKTNFHLSLTGSNTSYVWLLVLLWYNDNSWWDFPHWFAE